jgi:CRP/FNR family transcriptional regulator
MMGFDSAAATALRKGSGVRFDPAPSTQDASPRPRPLAKSLAFDRRQTIFCAGEPADHLYEVQDGAVLLTKLLPDGRRQVVELVRQGDVFGVSPGPDYKVTAEAARPTRVRLLARRDIAHDPALRAHIQARVERQLCRLQEHALCLGRKNAAERVASFLVGLTRDIVSSECPWWTASAKAVALELPMTRAEIADHLGLSLETVCRTMTDLERRGLIAIGSRHGEVEVVDICRLCRTTGVCIRE